MFILNHHYHYNLFFIFFKWHFKWHNMLLILLNKELIKNVLDIVQCILLMHYKKQDLILQDKKMLINIIQMESLKIWALLKFLKNILKKVIYVLLINLNNILLVISPFTMDKFGFQILSNQVLIFIIVIMKNIFTEQQ